MIKIIFLAFSILICNVAAADCDFKDAAEAFKQDLKKNYFGGKQIDIRFLPKAVSSEISSGEYLFVADGGKWVGPINVDLEKCTVQTNGTAVMWRTLNSSGSVYP